MNKVQSLSLDALCLRRSRKKAMPKNKVEGERSHSSSLFSTLSLGAFDEVEITPTTRSSLRVFDGVVRLRHITPTTRGLPTDCGTAFLFSTAYSTKSKVPTEKRNRTAYSTKLKVPTVI